MIGRNYMQQSLEREAAKPILRVIYRAPVEAYMPRQNQT